MGESVQCEMVKSFTSIGDASCSQCKANKRCQVYLALEQAQSELDRVREATERWAAQSYPDQHRVIDRIRFYEEVSDADKAAADLLGVMKDGG